MQINDKVFVFLQYRLEDIRYFHTFVAKFKLFDVLTQ